MSLSAQDIKRIAHLARIEVNENDVQASLQKLSGILGLIEQMQAVDTRNIVPMSHSQDVTQRLREDVVSNCDERELFQANAPVIGNGSAEPAVADGLYLVPKVIE